MVRSEKAWLVGPMLACFGLSVILVGWLGIEAGVVELSWFLSPLVVLSVLAIIAIVVTVVKSKTFFLPACAVFGLCLVLVGGMFDAVGTIEMKWPRLPRVFSRRPALDPEIADAMIELDKEIRRYEQRQMPERFLFNLPWQEEEGWWHEPEEAAKDKAIL